MKNINFQDISSIPQLIKDFLNEEISDFQEQKFNLKNIQNLINSKKETFSKEKRETLYSVLSEQLSGLQLSDLQKQNLEFLKDENTFTIVTGHQLNLFSGPAFFVYKILQTIKTTAFLKENFPAQNFVPIFWLASEDHDFDEINHFKTEKHYYEIKGKSGGAVGRIKVEEQFFIQQFSEEFKDTIFGTELIRWMNEAYAEGNTLAEATKILVNRLFSDYGLLMIDGDNARLKSQMKSVFRDEILEQKLMRFSKNKVEFLRGHYSKVQVNPREINLFYLSETRNRIEKKGNVYAVVDTTKIFSEEELLQELELYPEKFSPNALMRPVYQETILPNLAYIGGNAEIMYWLELKDYFQEINLEFPVLIPRNSFLFISEKTEKKIQKLQLSVDDFFKNFAQVINQSLLSETDLDTVISDNEEKLKRIFSELKTNAKKTDPTFLNLVNAEETRQLKAFQKMQKRLLRAERKKQSEKLQRMEQLFLDIHPAKNWQERVFNFSVFYADYGKDWLQNCYKKLDVEKSELIIIRI
ncbi:MAG: bacillithiol biosynthesis cysteine-adding enzyme BshC [Cruoricaptor ignavus]|nr:bacillithiol biosynthesis cysteine-adding enzyme BshC [Cruoricaptor ignavus]